MKILIHENMVVSNVLVADTFTKRFMGYMFRKKPHYKVIIIKPCNSIHTFFMKFSIDVLFINENMEVIKKIEDLPPGKIIMPVKKSKMVLESKVGLFKNIEVGSKIIIQETQTKQGTVHNFYD
ncbi:DUF192 domain-containing protein [Haloimpatiens sp. FM7330]|uniref:DUF192 domain-containing protein n=1 Tax=Haloimpatiens sp. FM7330 TaxID=3298610 RepID=UPI003625B7C8